ncbi:MAG: murein hydrolase activator EnvC family protein [Acidimicrobiia bacterium]
MNRLLLAAVFVLSPPVDGPVTRPFDPPAKPWDPGHRGVDYRVPPGTPVRSAAGGIVSFAGDVAGGLFVTVDHPGALQTSYAYLSRVDVFPGQNVEGTDVIGLSGGTGPGHGPDIVHFGVRRAGHYVDPALMSGPLLRVRLAPATPPIDPEIGPVVCSGRPESPSAGAATLVPDPASRPRIHTPASHR